MVSEIDLDAISPNANDNPSDTQFATDFNPMRRKLQILDN